MTRPFTASLKVEGEHPTSGGVSISTLPLSIQAVWALTYGSSSGQGDIWHAETRTLTASQAEDLDLTALTATGPTDQHVGATVTFAHLDTILVIADADNGSTVTYEPGASNGLDLFGTATVPVPAGRVSFESPQATVDASNKVLTFTNSDGSASATYTILLIGR